MCLSMQTDFRVMCENAMMYNKPETIYHKAAKKLLHSGMKILSPVRPSLLERQRDLTQINNRGQHLASHEDMMLLANRCNVLLQWPHLKPFQSCVPNMCGPPPRRGSRA